jgi:cytochrome o ubiquinol oxidase subunit 2
MRTVKRGWGVAVVILAVLIISGIYLSGVNIPVLEPKGPIADQEFRLALLVVGLMLIVVVPVFILLAYIVHHYRTDAKHRGKYSPDWDHSRIIETIWWLIPSILIAILAVITWNATYKLDPYRPIASKNPAITIEVISLDWKWLFIYPKQGIASVNQVVFPKQTPVHFYLTSDAPMNSFWIPQLSGQIYCMPGMQTQLYLMASGKGSYNGWSANISGRGFASMMFQAVSTSSTSFNTWVKQVRSSSPVLSQAAFTHLSAPSSYMPITYYSRPSPNLFIDTINSYMKPSGVMAGMK